MNRRNILNLSAITALGLASLPAGTIAQQKSLKDTVVGTWSITSVADTYEDGRKDFSFGTGVKGQITLDANGRMSLIVIGEKQAAMQTNDRRRPDALAVSQVGSYSVNEATKTITTKVERHSNSLGDSGGASWVVTINGDAMVLASSPITDKRGTLRPTIEVKRAL